MPLYLDRHDGMDFTEVTPQSMVEAHLKDLEVQVKYGVRYITGWVNQERGYVYCLVDAPSTEAATAVHREAHGMIADDIIEVDQARVEQFLGSIRSDLSQCRGQVFVHKLILLLQHPVQYPNGRPGFTAHGGKDRHPFPGMPFEFQHFYDGRADVCPF